MLQLFVFKCDLVTLFRRAEATTQIRQPWSKWLPPVFFCQCRSYKGWNFTPQVFGLPKLSTFAWIIVGCWTCDRKCPSPAIFCFGRGRVENPAFASLIWANLAQKLFSTCFTTCPRRTTRCSRVASDEVLLQCWLSKDCCEWFLHRRLWVRFVALRNCINFPVN